MTFESIVKNQYQLIKTISSMVHIADLFIIVHGYTLNKRRRISLYILRDNKHNIFIQLPNMREVPFNTKIFTEIFIEQIELNMADHQDVVDVDILKYIRRMYNTINPAILNHIRESQKQTRRIISALLPSLGKRYDKLNIRTIIYNENNVRKYNILPIFKYENEVIIKMNNQNVLYTPRILEHHVIDQINIPSKHTSLSDIRTYLEFRNKQKVGLLEAKIMHETNAHKNRTSSLPSDITNHVIGKFTGDRTLMSQRNAEIMSSRPKPPPRKSQKAYSEE